MTGETPLRLVAVGDIMLGRGVKRAAAAEALDLLSPELVQQLSGDIVTGNLECLVGSAGTPSPFSHSHFQGDPAFARSLVQRFHVVTMANNHIGDFGDKAVDETLAWLDQIGVRTVGIGRHVAEAIEPATFEDRRCKVAIFGATTVGTLTSSSRYTLAEPGPKLYRRAKDYVETGYTCVLHLHTGGGDVHHPSPVSRALLQEASDMGFSLVLGHHPHVVQGFVVEARRAIFFSLGDFLFDKFDDGRDRALMVALEISDDGTLSDPEVRVVKRAPDLSLAQLEGELLEQQMRELRTLTEMIRNGESDRAYLRWRGSKLARLRKSLVRDFQAGGIQALKAKLGRVKRRKLCELFLGR